MAVGGRLLQDCLARPTLPMPPASPCPACPARRHQSPSVLVPALRTVGNIVTGDDMQTQVGGWGRVLLPAPLAGLGAGPPRAPWAGLGWAAWHPRLLAGPSARCHAPHPRSLHPPPPPTHPTPAAHPRQIIINCGALPCLLNLLTTSHKKSIKKEACWTISNITAGTKEQIQVGGRGAGAGAGAGGVHTGAPEARACPACGRRSPRSPPTPNPRPPSPHPPSPPGQTVVDAGIVPPLVHLLATAEFDIKKEAAWAISNATSGGTNEQIKYLVSQVGCGGWVGWGWCGPAGVRAVLLGPLLAGQRRPPPLPARRAARPTAASTSAAAPGPPPAGRDQAAVRPAVLLRRAHRDGGAGGAGEHPEGGRAEGRAAGSLCGCLRVGSGGCRRVPADATCLGRGGWAAGCAPRWQAGHPAGPLTPLGAPLPPAHPPTPVHPRPPSRQVGEAEKELGGAAGTNPFAALVDEAEGLDKIEDLQVGGCWVLGRGWRRGTQRPGRSEEWCMEGGVAAARRLGAAASLP